VLLHAYTINAAKALCRDSQIGSIETGKEADFVLLDGDITGLSARDIAAVRPVWTMVHGKIVYQRDATDGPSHYKVVRKIHGKDGGWDYASFDPTARRLYVSRTDGVMSVDVDADRTTPQLIAGGKARAVVVLPRMRALVTFETTSEAVIFDARDGRRLVSLPMPKTPDAAVLEPQSERVYVMSKNGQVTIVDTSVAKVIGRIDVGGELEGATFDGHSRLYVNVADKGEVAVIDLTTRRVVDHYPLEQCEGPTGIAYAPGLDQLVAACDNGVAKILTASSGQDVSTLKIGGGADAVLYDSSKSFALIPSGDDASLTVIQLTHDGGRVVDRVATGRAAATGALDPTSGRLYLPSAEFSGTEPPEKRSAHLPGTFAVLVVSP
jgi:DNA-binding beta-propeller fold protein YncE